MPVFLYQVKDKTGHTASGKLEAPTIREAATRLREQGYFITALNPKGGGGLPGSAGLTVSAGLQFSFGKKVALKDLLLFSKQLAVLIKAGLNINTCLRILVEQTENVFFAKTISRIRTEVEEGEAFHLALKKYPKIFPSMYIHMVEAGEASGQLEVVLERLAEHLERENDLQKKVTGAMIYPSVLACVTVAAVFALMIYVVPTFTQMFEEGGMELPFVTKMLIGTSKFFSRFWYIIFGGLVGLVLGFKHYYGTSKGKAAVDHFIYYLPTFGKVAKKLAAARFTRTLATLLDSGVLITNAMEMVERAVGNAVVANAINKARVSINKGSGIAIPLAETKVLPLMVTQMISVGEETGELSTMLNSVADFYEKEAGYAVEGLTTLIEPAIIIIMGLVIGTVVTAIAIPMMTISSGATMH